MFYTDADDAFLFLICQNSMMSMRLIAERLFVLINIKKQNAFAKKKYFILFGF
jgi:hypothetical protein